MAPWNPPQHLVVVGPYRYVRNPMISGGLFILLAEALFFWSIPLWGLLAGFFLLNSIYIPLVEEPGLEKRFWEEYLRLNQWNPQRLPAAFLPTAEVGERDLAKARFERL